MTAFSGYSPLVIFHAPSRKQYATFSPTPGAENPTDLVGEDVPGKFPSAVLQNATSVLFAVMAGNV